MKRKQLRMGKGFRVALGNRRSQAAEMVLPPGDAEGDPKNRHHGADQWLFVVSGKGTATVNGKRYELKAGVLMLIERNDKHEIRNTGRALLRTLNFYVPPAYSKSGNPLPSARPGGS
jgi:mannose-6-phosphate isomerase-like protein (cupin superfamily)